MKTLDVVYIGLFAAVMAVCSWISIPLTVPITLQTFGVCCAVGLLGLKRGTLSVLVYIILGLVGVPVFAGFTSGVGILAGTTGGYIVGFVFTALIVGLMTKLLGNKLWVYNNGNADAVSLGTVLGWCVTPFIIPDMVKIALASVICTRVKKYVKD